MQLIVSSADRIRYGMRSGLYEICIFGNQDSSMALIPTEDNTGGRYTAEDSMAYTVNVPQKGSVYFRYTSQFLT